MEGAEGSEYAGGWLAFVPELRQLTWPPKFRVATTLKYDGTTNPREYLQVYSTAMLATGADDKTMANWFPMTLQPKAKSWLMNMPEGTIRSWKDLCSHFVSAFQGVTNRPGSMHDLQLII